MSTKRHKPEEMDSKLRQVKLLVMKQNTEAPIAKAAILFAKSQSPPQKLAKVLSDWKFE